MNNFEFYNPTRIVFGKDTIKKLNRYIAQDSRVLITYGGGSIKRNGVYEQVIEALGSREVYEFSEIEPNPHYETCMKCVEYAKKKNIDFILAVGGGSVIDATKFIGAGAYYEGDVWDILTGKAPVTDCLPIVTVLTLSATGSEMDAGGVISNLETKDKIGYMHPMLLPKMSFLDPTNTYTVNEYQTACGAADIMSHIIEVYFNMNQDLQMLDSVAEALMKTVIKYTPVAMKEPDNYEARANLMWTSSWAINGFLLGGKRQAWSCHPMEHELSAYYDITHGLGLAILTPRWMEYTLDETTVSKFYQFGCNVFDIDKNMEPIAVAKKSIEMLSDFFFNTLGLKSTFTEIGIDEANFSIMAKKSCGGDLLRGFKPLNQQDVENIFKMCL